jgi:hypothetical protein
MLSETLQKYPGLVIDWRVTITMCGRKEWISCPKSLSFRLEVRATRAEQWLKVIKKEIEDKLIAPMEANRPELPVIH